MRAERKSLGVRLFVFFTVAVAIGAALATSLYWGTPQWPGVVFFAVVLNLADRTTVEVPLAGLYVARTGPQRPVKLSPGFVVLLTAAFTLDPASATFIALFPAFPQRLLRSERDPIRVIFNSGQETIAMAASAVTFAVIREAFPSVAWLFVAGFAAALLAEVINTTLVASVVALDRKVKFRSVAEQMTWTIPHSLSFALIALLVSTLYKEFGMVAGIFLVMPLLALRFVRQAKLDLDAAYEETLKTFVRAIDRKSPYTRHHSEGVAEYVVALHRELGTPEKELNRRYFGALLHDVGKVAVSSRILTKAGALTDEEFAEMKTHPGVGADVVKEIDHLDDLQWEILYHHERMDGKGYPHGLDGESIPYAARVLAVADTFDALTNDRPYRQAMTKEEAIEELRIVSGSQLDADIVEAFARAVDAGAAVVRFPVAVHTNDHVAEETFASRAT